MTISVNTLYYDSLRGKRPSFTTILYGEGTPLQYFNSSPKSPRLTIQQYPLHRMDFNARPLIGEPPVPYSPRFQHTIGEGPDKEGSEETDAMELSVVESPAPFGPPTPFAPSMHVTRSQQSGRGRIPKRASSASAPESNQAKFFRQLGQNLEYLDRSIQHSKDETHIAYAELSEQAKENADELQAVLWKCQNGDKLLEMNLTM